MQKLYTLFVNSKENWKADIFYPAGLFCAVCMILLLSSFGTKATAENESYRSVDLIESAVNIDDSFAACCTRTVHNTTTRCTGSSDYVLYLANSHTGENKSYKGSNLKWEECDDGTARFTGTATQQSTGQTWIMDVTFSGGTNHAPSGSPKPNKCVSQSGLYYYTKTQGTLTNQANGGVVHISRRGEAFQVGHGANTVAPGFGGSGWLNTTEADWDIGDINVMLSQTCTSTCNPKITINNNSDCPINIYKWINGGDVFETTLQGGGSTVINTEDKLMWRATDSPDPDFHNLKFDKSYTSTNDCNQTWNLNTDYCAPDCSNIDVALGSDIQICAGESADISANATGQNCSVIYKWSGPGVGTATSQTVTVNQAGTYSVTVTDCEGCTATDELTVTLNSDVNADAGPDQSICEGASATLTASGGTIYKWNTGESTQSITVSPSSTTTYTVEVSNSDGCADTDEVTVDVGSFDGASASNNGPITCVSGDITITALPNGNSYSWSGPGGFTSNQQSAQVGVAGTYVVTVTNPEGCEDIAETIVEADETAPEASTSNDGPICDGGAVQIFGNSNGGNVSYRWTGQGLNANQQTSQNNTITGLAPGSYDYVLTVTNNDNGCETTSTTTVVITENPASGISAQVQVCAGEDAQFSAVPTVTGATYSWTFSGPATPASANSAVATVAWADVPGNYTATLVVEKDGCSSTFLHEITVTAEVRANAGPDQTICQGGSVDLDAVDSQGNGYLWTVVSGDPGSIDLGGTATKASVSPLVTTVYKLQVDDVANNCTKVDEVTVFVDVNFNPIADAGGPSVTICQGDKITLDGTGSLPPPAEPGANISYFWSPAQLLDNPISATPMATLTETTTFELIVSTDDGCRDTASVEIIVVPCDVSLEKTVSNAAPNVGETVTFTITATNEGGLPLSGIEIQDNVPNGYSAISNVSGGGSAAGSLVTWSGISLPVAGSTSVTFDAVVGIPGTNVDFKNTAQVTAMDQLDVDSAPGNDDGDQSEDDEDAADVEPAVADLSLIKTIDDATPSVGDVVTFTITVANAGPSNATGIVVEDLVPNGYTNISAAGGSVTGNNVTWTGVSVAAGSSTLLTLSAEVVAPTAGTSYVNIAEITGADQYDPDSEPDNGADTNGNGVIGSEDPDGSQDPADEDDGDDASIVPNGSIWGAVLEDTNNDGTGDAPIAGVTITLKDDAGNVVATQVTDADGKYDFLDLAPGNYTVEQTQPNGFDNVSDQDGTPDGDAGDSDTVVDNSIDVTVNAGEADMTNDFVEELLTSIWGDVTEDLDGNGTGDVPIPGVTITLKDATGAIIGTAVTDADGKYDFINLPAGDYTVEQTQPANFEDVSDQDESPDGDVGDSDTTIDNSISVSTVPGEADMDNDFVESGLTSIWGDVTEDTNGDGVGDLPIAEVIVNLFDANGSLIDTDVTGQDGKYDFLGLPAGDYTVVQVQPSGFNDVSDQDESPDGDAGDSDMTVDNSIVVTTTAAEADMDNDFIEEKLAEISGTVKEDLDGDGIGDQGVQGVTIELLDAAGNVIATAVTDAQGFYNFTGLAPGTYKLNQIDLPGFEDVSDTDSNTPGGDTDGANDPQDDMIPVVLTAGEFDDGNDFVEEGLTSIWGDVTEDSDGDGLGDVGISGVTINLFDAAGNLIDTDVTDNEGKYDFTGLLRGDYLVQQSQPAGFVSVSDQDESPDGDAGDSDTTVDDAISVTTTGAEQDMDNDFVEQKLSSISGTVSEDTDNDGIGDRPLSGITVELRDAAGNLVASEGTDSNGDFEFLNIVPGTYTLVQIQPAGFIDVSDEDGTPDPDGGNDPVDNEIPVVVSPGENDDDNDFVDKQLVSIGSTVFEDANNNGTKDAGEPGIAGINVAAFLDANADGLPDSNNPAATDVTDASGNYYLGGLEPGKYVVIAQSPAGLDNSSTSVGGDNGVDDDNNGSQPLGAGTPASSGTIMLVPDTEPTNEGGSGGNQESLNGDQDDDGDMTIDFGFFGGASLGDFVWFDINGNGAQDPGEPGLQGVTVNLLDAAGNLVSSTTSGPNGQYSFAGIAPGDYIVEFVTPASYTEVIQVGGTTPGNGTTNSDYDPANGRTSVITVNSGDAISGIDGGFNLILDVSLTSFTGRYVEDRDLITLEWITSTEINSDYYILERSYDNADYTSIARVAANGNTNTESLYAHNDEDILSNGVYTYRLVQVAQDGSQEISDVITVNVRRSFVAEPSVNVFPNPVSNIVNVDIVKNESDAVSVKLFDLTGKAMSMSSINIVAKGNSASIQIPVQDLPRAAYILRINVGDQVFAKKITLIK